LLLQSKAIPIITALYVCIRRLGSEVVDALKPDEIFIATGSTPRTLSLEGFESETL